MQLPRPLSASRPASRNRNLRSLLARRAARPLDARGLSRVVRLTATAAALTAAIGCSSARAGTIAVVSCKDPVSGAVEPTEGWSEMWLSGTPEAAAGNVNACPEGNSLVSWVGAEGPHPSSAGPAWRYDPPEGDAIVGGELFGEFITPGSRSAKFSGQAGLTAPGLAFDGANLIAYSGGTGRAEGTYSLAGHTHGDIYIYASCHSVEAECPTGQSLEWYWSYSEVIWADIDLSNNATPAATGFAGTVAESPSRLTGHASLTFAAHDEGSGATGVYRVKATLDGNTIYDATPDSNGGSCATLPPRQTAILEFASAHPCRTTESVAIPVSTPSVKDGVHELTVTVFDAAGNSAIVYSHAITTVNAPGIASEASVTGAAVVGETLTATPAAFSAPEGAGGVTVAGAWLRCTDAAGTRCSAIPGATAPTYVPAAGDVGYYLVYATTGSDTDGSTTAQSSPTLAVTTPPHEPSQEGGAGGSGGGGSGGSGGSAGGGSGGPGGAGGAGAPGSGAGGVTVNLTTPPTVAPLLGSSTPWVITLIPSRRAIRRGQTVVFSGRVTTTPRPGTGKLVYLQARSVTVTRTGRRGHRLRRTVYGGWVPFAVVRTGPAGSYRAAHRFKLGGRHTYQFRAVAPQESGYLDPTGYSHLTTVTERPSAG